MGKAYSSAQPKRVWGQASDLFSRSISMGFLDVIRSIFSGGSSSAYPDPVPPSAQVQQDHRAALAAAEAAGDYSAIMSAISDLDNNAWLWDECEAAYLRTFERFPAERASVAMFAAQTLYLGSAGYKVKLSDTGKADVYERALKQYEIASKLGERSQGLNYIEMCEWLAGKSELLARARPYVERFDTVFPASEYAERAQVLRAKFAS
jgi:hypothetical protein